MLIASSRLLVFASLREGPSKEEPPGRRRLDPGLGIIDVMFPNIWVAADWRNDV